MFSVEPTVSDNLFDIKICVISVANQTLNRGDPGLPKTSKKEEYATIVRCLIIVTKHFIANAFGDPGLASIKKF